MTTIKKKPVPQKKKKTVSQKGKLQKKVTIEKNTVLLNGPDSFAEEFLQAMEGSPYQFVTGKEKKSVSKNILCGIELTLENSEEKKRQLVTLDAQLPADIPLLTNALTVTVLEQAQWIKHPQRLVGISLFPTLIDKKIFELSPSLYTERSILDSITSIFSSAKKETALVTDAVGMVMPRILCQIINEAVLAVQNDVATPKDIDIAMKYGTNYPMGPIEWAEKIGFKNIVYVLDALYDTTHEERYRIAPLLRQMALAGTFWRT